MEGEVAGRGEITGRGMGYTLGGCGATINGF